MAQPTSATSPTRRSCSSSATGVRGRSSCSTTAMAAPPSRWPTGWSATASPPRTSRRRRSCRSGAAGCATTPSRGSVRTWVLGIVHNRTIDALRRGKVHERRRETFEGDRGAPGGARADRRGGGPQGGGAQRARARSTRCRTEQRRTIELAYFGGLQPQSDSRAARRADRHHQGTDAPRARQAAASARRLRGRGIRMTDGSHDLPRRGRRVPARRAVGRRARRLRGAPRGLRASAATRSSGCGPAADLLPRSVEQVEPPPSLKRSLMEVVEREAQEAARRAERAAGAPAAARACATCSAARCARSCVAGGLLLGLLAGFGIAQLGGDERRPHAWSPRVEQRRAPRGQRAASRSRATAATAAILRVSGMPALRGGQVYQAWVQRDGMIEPEPTFEVGPDGRGAVAVPEDLSDAKAVHGDARAARRVARAQREAAPDASALLAAASFSLGGDLLPPPGPRDRRALLELRAADLPGLHDVHAGRHALPRVRPPAHEGARRSARPATSRCSPTS